MELSWNLYPDRTVGGWSYSQKVDSHWWTSCVLVSDCGEDGCNSLPASLSIVSFFLQPLRVVQGGVFAVGQNALAVNWISTQGTVIEAAYYVQSAPWIRSLLVVRALFVCHASFYVTQGCFYVQIAAL
jgi:hypothetical protein